MFDSPLELSILERAPKNKIHQILTHLGPGCIEQNKEKRAFNLFKINYLNMALDLNDSRERGSKIFIIYNSYNKMYFVKVVGDLWRVKDDTLICLQIRNIFKWLVNDSRNSLTLAPI